MFDSRFIDNFDKSEHGILQHVLTREAAAAAANGWASLDFGPDKPPKSQMTLTTIQFNGDMMSCRRDTITLHLV
jgi:hypothetical protein